MATGDTPMMASSAYTSSAYDLSMGASDVIDQLGQLRRFNATPPQPIPQPNFHFAGVPMSERRVIQVFIADPNENIPLADCLLYKGEEKLTDATDQELFFELDIKNLLEKHNLKRTKVVDKKVKDRTEYLEPAKVRDLKMVVVTVAKL